MKKPRVVDHPLYGRWRWMRDVCSKPNYKDYAKFGGRGIKVDPAFEKFWDFVAIIETHLGYPDDFSFDTKLSRRDLDGDFTIDNLCWDKNKSIGRRHSRAYQLTYNGETKPIRAWCEELGINFYTLLNRMMRHWEPAQCLGYELGPRASENLVKRLKRQGLKKHR